MKLNLLNAALMGIGSARYVSVPALNYPGMADTSLTPSHYTKSFGDYNSSVESPAYLGLFTVCALVWSS
jgi:hypothetical protein